MNKWLLTAGLIGTASQAIAAAGVSAPIAPPLDTIAPKVTASPASGTYSVAQSVKLAVKDNRDSKPVIYYTTDGSLPKKGSKVYSGELIKVADTKPGSAIDTYVKTLAYDASGNASRNTFSYRIQPKDTQAPSVVANPKSGTYTSAQKVVLIGKDDSGVAPKIYYTTDGSLPSKSSVLYREGQALNAVDKGDDIDFRVRTLAYDAAGNAKRSTFTYKIGTESSDVIAPTVTPQPAPGKYTGTTEVSFKIEDNKDKAPKLYYTLDGSAASPSSTLYSGAISLTASKVINTYAVDAAGNKVSGKYSYEIGDVPGGVGDGYLLDTFVSPGIAIYVKSGWTKTNLHSFSVLPVGTSTDTKWPGNPMTDIGNSWSSAIFPGASSVSMVFNNGAGTQYPTGMGGKEIRTESGCLDIASKAWTTLADCKAPLQVSLSSSVASGKFADELEVTLSIMGADANATGYLTLDGVAPTASHGLLFKNGQKLKLGKKTAVGKEIKLWLSAGGKEATYTYTKVEKLPGLTVQIHAPQAWANANVHYFNAIPATTLPSTWPGVAMSSDGEGWYSYTVPNLESASLVFNMNGDATKTKDLVASKGGCFEVAPGALPSVVDCPTPLPKPSASPAGGKFNSDSVDVALTIKGKDITKGCYTLDGKDPAVSCEHPFTSGDVISVGKDLAVDQSVTLKLYGKSDLGEGTKEYTFTKGKPIDASAFSWDNATVYFVLTDRFRNGDTSNDHSYGRECPKSAYDKMTGKVNTAQCWSGYEKRTGNFRGGDLKGMLEKLNAGYFNDLGVNAIWLSVPLEQTHGFVGGKNFKHYSYHGYYILDFTKIDANIGDEALMKEFIDTAHKKGIRIIFDVVMNHVGYDTMADADEYGFAGLKAGWESYYYTKDAASIHYETYGPLENYADSNWSKWWGSDWVRSKAYSSCTGGTEETRCLDDLPDLKLESTSEVGLPPVLVTKWTREGRLAAETAELDAFFQKSGLKRTSANYVIKWLTDWVREYGVDGFRCDTAKHVPLNVWKELKVQSDIALKEWQAKPGVIKPDDQDLPFWMTAEVWGHGVGRSAYFDNGFDNIINFSFQKSGVNIAGADAVFSSYDKAVNSDPTFNVLNYISSHDTALYSRADLINGGTMLLLTPGVAQIFYGDETARPVDTTFVEWNEHHRSMMNWCDSTLGSDLSPCVDKTVLAHWQKIGQFRNKHTAIGAGAHSKIADTPYTFSRVRGNDKVVIAFASGPQSISVGSIFAEGTAVVDAYTGTKATVTGGKVSVNAGGVVLLEKQ